VFLRGIKTQCQNACRRGATQLHEEELQLQSLPIKEATVLLHIRG